jgi:hypothetical protein
MGSGTTLLALLLGQRLETAGVVTESARQISRSSFLHMPRTDSYASVAALTRALDVSASWDVTAARSDLSRLYRRRAFRSSEWIVDKGPNANLVRARQLKEAFPDSRFVAIFRDPVANVEGIRRKWSLFAESSLEEAIEFYRTIHEAFLEAIEEFSDDCLLIDYDEMVRRDAEYIRGLSSWLDIGAPTSSLPMRDRPNVKGRGVRAVSGKTISVVQGASGEAYARLSSTEVEAIQMGLSDLMSRLGELAWRP